MSPLDRRGYYFTRTIDGVVEVEENFLKWAQWFETAYPRGLIVLDRTDVDDAVCVSTIFLGMNHNHGLYGDSPFRPDTRPILYETMIFRKLEPPEEVLGRTLTERGCEQWRWHTEDEAKRAHGFIVSRLREEPAADLGDYDPLATTNEIDRLECMVDTLAKTLKVRELA